MDLQVGVKVLLKNNEGKFLLIRRSPKKYPEVGPRWDIVGCRINPGTELMENLKREVKEEVGLDLNEHPKLVAAQDILRVPGRHVVRLTHIGKIDGHPKIDEESLEFGWFDMEDIKKMKEEELDIYFKELLNKGLFEKFI